MAEDPRIVRPSVPFIDERTGTIAIPWYNWLLSLVQKVNTTEITNVFNSSTSVTQELSATSAAAQSSRLVAETPVLVPQVSKRDAQDARFQGAVPSPLPQVSKRDLQDARVALTPARNDLELSKRVDAIAIQLAQLNAMSSGLSGKIQELQIQLAMKTQTFPTWTLGQANTVSPTSPNRTLTVAVGGTPYYIHAKTTND